MTLHPDSLLGRDYFYRRPGERLASITIVAVRPADLAHPRRWQLVCRGMQAAWVPDEMLIDLFEEGVLS